MINKVQTDRIDWQIRLNKENNAWPAKTEVTFVKKKEGNNSADMSQTTYTVSQTLLHLSQFALATESLGTLFTEENYGNGAINPDVKTLMYIKEPTEPPTWIIVGCILTITLWELKTVRYTGHCMAMNPPVIMYITYLLSSVINILYSNLNIFISHVPFVCRLIIVYDVTEYCMSYSLLVSTVY